MSPAADFNVRDNVHSSVETDSFSSNDEETFFSGYRSGVIMSASTATVVLLLNIIFCAWAVGQHGLKYYSGTLMKGSCSEMRKKNTAIHILINVLSSILLGGSNYCMQCLTAPTRQDVDNSHAQSRWLDIGVPSLRNLRVIGWKRVLLWLGIGLSSAPLHLL